MECNKNSMPMIFSESHRVTEESKTKNKKEVLKDYWNSNEKLPMAAVRNIGQ